MPPIALPPENRLLSPYTGWTRAHWEAVADHLLAAVHPHAGPAHALIDLPGPRSSVSGRRSDALEGYARTFLLAALRVAGAGGADPDGLLDRYAEGLAAGTRTPTAEPDLTDGDLVSWPAIPHCRQALVEAASIAVGLRLTRPWLWDRLDPGTRLRVRDWLAAGLGDSPVDNNWWLFPAMVGGFLVEAGLDRDGTAQLAVDRGLARIEQWYLGDGWYTDGRPRAFDHYNGWAFHLYPLLHAHLAGDRQLLDRYGTRLAAHLDGYARTFGGDGAPVHQGRSLTYRFAAAAPLWAGALTGHSPLSPGTTRRLASGALRYFVDGGGVGADGLLPLGWFGPCLPMVQPYSGPASPYWASKGFLGLLLPADHPAWTATEEQGPAGTEDAVHPLPRPGWLVQSTAADGLVRLHNHGSDDQLTDAVLPDDPLYARLAHSTATAPVFDGPADNHIGLVRDGEVSERGRIHPLGAGDGWAASWHRPRIGGRELPGVTITSLVLACGADEVHAHLVAGAQPDFAVRQSGWAVSGEAVRSASGDGTAHATAERSDGTSLSSVLRAVHGFAEVGSTLVPQGTAFGPRAALPEVFGVLHGSGPQLFVAVARLGVGPAKPPTREVSVDAVTVRVRRPDGRVHEATLSPGAITVHVTLPEEG